MFSVIFEYDIFKNLKLSPLYKQPLLIDFDTMDTHSASKAERSLFAISHNVLITSIYGRTTGTYSITT